MVSLSSESYYFQLRLLLCTLRASNPTLLVTVSIVPWFLDSEAGPGTAVRVAGELAKDFKVLVMPTPDLSYASKVPRYGRNWVRLRFFDLQGVFSSILHMDADMTVHQSLDSVFASPAVWAQSVDMTSVFEKNWAQDYTSFGQGQAGMFLLRPCKEIYYLMRLITVFNPVMQFNTYYCEQSFLDWFFKYRRVLLPPRFNFPSHGYNRLNMSSNNNPDMEIYDIGAEGVAILHYFPKLMNREAMLDSDVYWFIVEAGCGDVA